MIKEKENNSNDIEQISQYILTLQDDLENIAMHLKDLMDKMEVLEKNQNKPQEKQVSNINFDYINALIDSDVLERENKIQENITQNILKNMPTHKNNQSIINIIIFTLIIVCLYLVFRR